MKLNPEWVNAKYEGSFIWRDTGDDMKPYIQIAAIQGFRTVINPVWLHNVLTQLPWELWNPNSHDKKAISAWINLTHDVSVTTDDLPDYLT